MGDGADGAGATEICNLRFVICEGWPEGAGGSKDKRIEGKDEG